MLTRWLNHKKGCTGKVWYKEARYARIHVDRLYGLGKPSQAYKCRYCGGYHVTSSVLRINMTCPAFCEFEKPRKTHVFRVARFTDVRVAACIYCGIRVDNFVILNPVTKRILSELPLQAEAFKCSFVNQLTKQSDERIWALSMPQKALVDHLLNPPMD